MKDIYETLNDINFDTSEYEKLDVKISEVSKKRLKKKVGKEINVQYSRRYKTLASICKIGVVVILLLGTMGITNQTIAKTISNTIKYFQESIFYNREYEKYSKGMDLISRDNKISIKLNSVVYDGSSLYLAYEVSTETPLKYGVKIWSSDITINGNKINGNKKISIDGREFQDDIFRNCDYLVEKDSDNEKYVVTTRWDLTDYKLDNKSEVSIEWNINNIHGIDGKWSFKFKVLKEELMDKLRLLKI